MLWLWKYLSISFGLVTNINVDHKKYKDVDELINKGIITIPGSRETISKLIKNIDGVEEPEMTQETLKSDENNIILDTPENDSEMILDTPEDKSPIVDTIPDEKPLEDIVPAEPVEVVETTEETNEEVVEKSPEEVVEVSSEETVETTEEVVEDTPKKKKTKKTE